MLSQRKKYLEIIIGATFFVIDIALSMTKPIVKSTKPATK